MYMTDLCAILARFLEIERITHFCALSNQIVSYINVFNINTKLLTQAFTCMSHIVCQIKCAIELSVDI